MSVVSDLDEIIRIAAEERRNAERELRESIAANVERLGCGKYACNHTASSDPDCPLAIAAATSETEEGPVPCDDDSARLHLLVGC